MRLTEGRKEFLAWCNNDKDLLNKFLEFRKKVSGNEANMDWWVSKKTPDELRDFMANYKSKNQKEKEEKIAGTEIIYDDDNWKVIHILNYNAAKHYGGDSTWCITGRYPGHEERGQYYFNSYLQSNYSGYYLFVNKNMTDPRKDAKYMVCPKQSDPSNSCDIYDQEHNPSTIPYIPNCTVSIPGFPSVGQFSIDKDGTLTGCKVRGSSVVTIPQGVTKIGPRAFRNAEVETVNLANGTLKEIASGAFASSDIDSIIIPPCVEKIGASCFLGCEYLIKAKLGKGIRELPKRCFSYCDKLRKIIIEGVITSVDDNWLEGDTYEKTTVIVEDPNNEKLIAWCKANNVDCMDGHTGALLADRDSE